jgi:Mg2+/Co2+ transporter CorC
MYGGIPPIGEVLRYEYLEIKIVKATKQKVLKVRVNALEDEEEIEKAKERD